MSDEWYYADSGKTVGPLPLAELGAVLRRARDPKAVPVWQQGFANWEKAGDMKALAAYMIKPPAPPHDTLPGPRSPMAAPGGAAGNEYVAIVRSCLTSKYADFNGRAPRKEFWVYHACLILVFLVLNILQQGAGSVVGGLFAILQLILMCAIIVPSLAVGCRRLHDTDRTGWWQLISFVPLVGFVTLIVFWCLPGTIGDNRFGPDPYEGQVPAAASL